jgi:hypothetical protein
MKDEWTLNIPEFLIRPAAEARAKASASDVKRGVIWENKMSKDELIVKQQLEIEELKTEIDSIKSACHEARETCGGLSNGAPNAS